MVYKLALTKEEKKFLYRKYILSGCSPKEAYGNVQSIMKHMRVLVNNLLKQKKTYSNIENRFREEFEKMCMSLEAKYQ